MTYLSPFELAQRRRRRLMLLAAFLSGLTALTLLDRTLFFALRTDNRAGLERGDWYQFLRAMGYLPTWLAAGGMILLHDIAVKRPSPVARGGLLMVVPALGGAAAELLKFIAPRQRPINNGLADGAYVWDLPFAALAGKGNFGLASSHAGVAFGAAFVILRLFPGAGWVALPLALGCGLTRLLSGAHFTTDVYVAAWMSGAIAAWLTHRLAPNDARAA